MTLTLYKANVSDDTNEKLINIRRKQMRLRQVYFVAFFSACIAVGSFFGLCFGLVLFLYYGGAMNPLGALGLVFLIGGGFGVILFGIIAVAAKNSRLNGELKQLQSDLFGDQFDISRNFERWKLSKLMALACEVLNAAEKNKVCEDVLLKALEESNLRQINESTNTADLKESVSKVRKSILAIVNSNAYQITVDNYVFTSEKDFGVWELMKLVQFAEGFVQKLPEKNLYKLELQTVIDYANSFLSRKYFITPANLLALYNNLELTVKMAIIGIDPNDRGSIFYGLGSPPHGAGVVGDQAPFVGVGVSGTFVQPVVVTDLDGRALMTPDLSKLESISANAGKPQTQPPQPQPQPQQQPQAQSQHQQQSADGKKKAIDDILELLDSVYERIKEDGDLNGNQHLVDVYNSINGRTSSYNDIEECVADLNKLKEALTLADQQQQQQHSK